MKKIVFLFLFVSTFCYSEYKIAIGCDSFSRNYKQPKKDESFPKTVDEATDRLIENLDLESKIIFKSRQKYDLIEFHHGFGTGIRNPKNILNNSIIK